MSLTNEDSRKGKKKSAKYRGEGGTERGRGGSRGQQRAIHNSVRIMSLTTRALTLPGVDRFQMRLVLERCQVLLSSVGIFELLWPQ